MSYRNENTNYTIGPYWTGIIVTLIAFVGFSILLEDGGIRPYRPWESVSVLHLIVFAGLMAQGCRTYTLDDYGITVKIFRLVIQRVSWNQIGQVVVIRSRTGSINKHSDGVIFVPRANCAPFRPSLDKIDRYAGRHIFRVFTICGSTKKIDQHANAFISFFENVTILDTHE